MAEQLSKGSVSTDRAAQFENKQPAKQQATIEVALGELHDNPCEEEDELVVKERGRPRKNASSRSDTRVEDEHRSGGSKSSVEPDTDNQEDEKSQEEEDEPPNKRKILLPGSDSENPQKEATISCKKRGVPSLKDTREKVHKCPQPECRFWAKLVDDFHHHVLGDHGSGEPFKCTVCKFRAQQWVLVFEHILDCREARDGAHSKADIACLELVPWHRYAGTIQLLEVPENRRQGLLPRFESSTLPSFAIPSCTGGVHAVEDIVQMSLEEEARYRAELGKLEEDIQNGYRSIEAARQETDAAKIPDLIAAQKILILKHHTVMKPIIALEWDQRTKSLLDQLIYL